MSLGVNPVPGTDAGYILSDLYETNHLETTGEPVTLPDGTRALPVETRLDAALRQAREEGWELVAEPEWLPYPSPGHEVYVTYLRRRA